MKKALVYLSILCPSALAAPYYLTTPAGGGLTPYDWQPTQSLEGLYALGTGDTPDTAGFRYGLELYNNRADPIRHEFTLNAAPQWGNDHTTRQHQRTSQHLFHLPATLGYTINIALSEPIFLMLGGKAGWAWGRYKEKSSSHHESDTYNGFTFSAGAGIKIQCSEQFYAHIGYEFGRTYTNTWRDSIWGQHIITAGLGWQF